MAQRNIDFGTFPDDPDADAIRTAFQKTQENFSELFSGLQDQAVISVNRTAGAGITVNSPTGNVIVTANIACVQVSSNTLGVNRDSPVYVAGGNTTITSSSQTLVIELPYDIANVDNIVLNDQLTANTVNVNLQINGNVANFSGNVTAANLIANSTLSVTGNANVGNIGAATGVFTNAISVTGAANVGSLNTGAGTFTANISANNANFTNNVTANIVTGSFLYGDGSNISNVTAIAGNKIVNGLSQVFVTLNGNVTSTVAGADVLVVTASGANITGTLNATGNLTAVNANLGNSVTANFFVGNLYGQANTAVSATTAGTVTTAAQPNITSVGTLTSLNVTGNANVGNIGATNGVFTNVSGNGSALSSITGANVTGAVGFASVANSVAGANVSGQVSFAATANSVAGSNVSGTVANATHALTSNTVVNAAQSNITSVGTLTGLNVNGTVTAVNITANTGVFTGNGSGLSQLTGANVTGTVANATYAVSAGSATTAGTVTTNAQPNITSVGTLSSLSVTGNVTSGNANLGNAVNANFFIGSGNNLSNIQGSNVTGTVSSATTATTAGTVTTAAQPNITSVGSLTSLTVSGNINAGNVNLASGIFSGNGSGLTQLTGANVTGTVANATYALNAGNATNATSATSATTAGTVTTNAQPNITSVGTLSSLSVAGNIATGNLTGANAVVANFFIGSGNNLSNIQGANVTGAVATATSATTAGTVTTAAQPNITSTGTLTSLTVSGNLSAANISGGNLVSANFLQGDGSLLTNISVGAGSYIVNGTSNVEVDTNSNVRISVAGNANRVVVTGTGANINGYANVTGNLTAGNVTATLLTGTLTTGSQPNVTSVGTLIGLNVNGTSNLGPNSNVIITGGVNGAFLKTDGSGALSWDTATLVPAQGSNTQVIFNDGGSTYAGSANLTFDKTTRTLTVANAISAANIIGTIAATSSSQPNIREVGNLGSLTVAPGSVNQLVVSGTNVTIGTNRTNNLRIESNTVFDTDTTVTFNNMNGDYILLNGGGSGDGLSIQNSDVNATVTLAARSQGFYGDAGLFIADGATKKGIVFANSGQFNFVQGTLTTNAQPNITSTGTLTSLIVSGNINAGNLNTTGVFSGNGASLTNIPGANVTGTVANATFATSAGSATTAGTVTNASQSNITSVGTLTSLTVSGNASAGNLNAGNLLTANFVAGTLTTAAQPNITSLGSLTSLIVNGNINAGNIAGGNLVSANFFSGNANALFSIQGGNVVGTVANATFATSASSATSATTAGTVTTAAQPNITSVGTLTSLGVNGTVTAVNFTANTGVFAGSGANLTTLNASNISSGTLAQARLANSSLTVNGTSISLGGSGTITANTTQSHSNGSYITGGSFNGGTAITWAVDATDAATANKVVARDANASFAGNVITATTFSGSGSSITSINASNISSGTLAQARLANASLTVNGTSITLGSSGTITANTTQTLTLGTYLTGTSFNGGTAVTAAVDATTTNTASKVVARDANGSFSANIITATLSGSATSAGTATTAGTVTTNAQPNITSTGTLTSLTVGNVTSNTVFGNGTITATGNISASNVSVSGFHIRSVTTGIAAAGSTQGTATAITTEINTVSTVASGAGVRLPTAVAGMVVTITNLAANTLLVYPHTSGDINGGAANVAYSHPANATLQYITPNTTDWYTVGATYA
jgi:hypothetical protein